MSQHICDSEYYLFYQIILNILWMRHQKLHFIDTAHYELRLLLMTDEVYFRTAGVRVSFGRTEFWKWHRTPYLINYTKWFPGEV